MDQLEDLSQRIFDIHQSILCASGDQIDPDKILELEVEMSKLENDISLIEEKVGAQMHILQQIPGLVEKFKQIHQECTDLPSPNRYEAPTIRLAMKSSTIQEETASSRIPEPAKLDSNQQKSAPKRATTSKIAKRTRTK